MEQLNKIEVRGNVGNVNIQKVGESRVAHFTVATNYAYKNRNNEPIYETTWFNVTAWEGRSIPDVSIIVKGEPVYLTGRIRIQKYAASDGTEKVTYEVIANNVEKVNEIVSAQVGQ